MERAAAFVFSQGIEIAPDAVLSGGSGGAVSIGAAALNNVSGVAAINLAVGTGNQQANNIRIGTAVNRGSGSAGSGSLNIEAAQTIDDSGVLDAIAVNGPGDSASLGPDALQNVSGVVAINLAAGTANQQINNIVWQNKPAAPLSGLSRAERSSLVHHFERSPRGEESIGKYPSLRQSTRPKKAICA